MSHLSEYLSISSRIKSLCDAALMVAQLNGAFGRALRGQVGALADEAAAISEDLQQFFSRHDPSLPATAKPVNLGAAELHKRISSTHTSPDNQLELTLENLVKLRLLDSRILHVLSSSQQQLISLTERALRHLQWTLLCDEDFREKWKTAFKKGEVACERLGMVHLLWHGIFAFKTDGGKARSDLVAGEITREATAAAEGLVLTEWKLLHKENPEKILAKALTQAKAYKSGHLGGTELHEVRYIVLVSEKQQSMPIDVVDGGIVYRYINISVDPYTLSKAAAKTG